MKLESRLVWKNGETRELNVMVGVRYLEMERKWTWR